MESALEVIDGFVDGERVDAAALKAALADSAGRDYLIDAWLLREAVREVGASDAVAVPARAAGRPSTAFRHWLVAAGIAGALVSGYALGSQRSEVVSVPSSGQVTNPAVTPAAAFPAPPPTRVIQIEFQTDATGTGGD